MKTFTEIIIDKLDKKTIAEQVNVYSKSFNYNGNKNELINRWILKHYSNPIENSLIFGAFIENELVGINAFQPSIYLRNKANFYVLQSCESGVLPNYRGLGIWQKIMDFAVEYIQNNTQYVAIIGFPNYNNSYHGFVKMGWKTLYYMDNWLVVNNSKKLIASITDKSMFKFFHSFLSLQKTAIYFRCKKRNKFVIDDKLSIDDFKLGKDNDSSNDVHLDINREYIKYKINYKNLLKLQVKKDNVIISECFYEAKNTEKGEIIIINKIFFYKTSSKINRKSVAIICDYILKKHSNSILIRYWGYPNSLTNKIFKQLLFFKTFHKNPFIIKDLNKDYLSNDSWNVSFLDLD